MYNGRLRSRIRVCCIRPQRPHADPRDARRGDDPAGVRERRVLHQQRLQLLDRVEHALDVQIHHLAERIRGVCLERSPPCSSGIGEEDVDVVGCLRDLGGEAFDLGDLRRVGGDGDGAGAGAFPGQGVQFADGLVAGAGFAGGDVDFGAAGLEEAGWLARVTQIGLKRCHCTRLPHVDLDLWIRR